MFLIVYYLIVSALAAACTASDNCVAEQCEMVGSQEICKQCKAAGNVPINGACAAVVDDIKTKCLKADGKPLNEQDATCGQCGTGYFLYKGGCYDKATPPGSTICAAQTTAGVCATCNAAKGFFNNPTAAVTVDSCISCDDTAGVTTKADSNTKTYKGVAGCAKCTAPSPITESTGAQTAAATCTECSAELYLKTETTGATSCVASNACTGGFFPTTDGTTDNKKRVCVSCGTADKGGITDCTACVPRTDDPTKAKCTACDKNKKPSLDGKSCNSCTDTNCAFCASGGACQKCASGYILDGAACTQQTCSTPDCRTCNNPKTANEACTACVSNYYLTPAGQCISNCAALSGYYGDTDKTCKRCDPSCAECVGASANQCSACPAGRALRYAGSDPSNGGSCGEQCAVSADGCADCGARIGGTAYCSRCRGSQVPINGVCVANNARQALCTSSGDGTCSACTEGQLLKDGGCYETTRQPGEQVCSKATGGKCTQCANGLTADNGACGVCHASCATCATANNVNACKTCAAGYYKESASDGSCKPCSEGLAGCRQCTATAAGTFVCLEMGDATDSENKSGLSTGAIAGISVAAVVVVGGLVGFLCWWFICRGKA